MKNDSIWDRWLRQTIARLAGVIVVIAVIWFVREQMLSAQHQRPLVTTAISVMDDEPPPPPKKEILEQPELDHNQEIVDLEGPEDDTSPTDDMLGIDTGDIMAGTDAFGLEAKLGGKSLIEMLENNSIGVASPLEIYRFYATQIERHIESILSDQNELRLSTYEVIVKIWIGHSGTITRCQIAKSTGNNAIDLKIVEAIESLPALPNAPPDEMPQPIGIKIKSQDYG